MHSAQDELRVYVRVLEHRVEQNADIENRLNEMDVQLDCITQQVEELDRAIMQQADTLADILAALLEGKNQTAPVIPLTRTTKPRNGGPTAGDDR